MPQPKNQHPGRQRLVQSLKQGKLPPGMQGGRFGIGPGGGVIDKGSGVYSARQAATYQRLYNAAQKANVNIVGQSGQGGGYNPTRQYATQKGYVDLETGRRNAPSVGGNADVSGYVKASRLAKLQKQAGYTGPTNYGAQIAGGASRTGQPAWWESGTTSSPSVPVTQPQQRKRRTRKGK